MTSVYERNLHKKLEEAEERYMSRGEIMENIEYPPDNRGLVVTKSNFKGTGFLRTCYNERYLKDYISKKEFLKVIDRASKLMALEYSRKRKSDSKSTPLWIKLALAFSGLLLLAFAFMAYYMPEVDKLWFDILTYCILAFSFLIVIVVTTMNLFIRTKVFYTYNDMVRFKLSEYFNHENTIWEQRGIQWYFVLGHYWLET